MLESHLNAIYDLRVCSPGFDFLSFLMMADSHRALHRLTDLHVFIVLPNEGVESWRSAYQRDSDIKLANRFLTNRVDNILKKSCKLFPSVNLVNVLSVDEFSDNFPNGTIFPVDYTFNAPIAQYNLASLFEQNKRGTLSTSIEIPEQYKTEVKNCYGNFDKTLSISLRNTPHDPARNSQVEDWVRFAENRIAEGYKVLWLDDVDAKYSAASPQGAILVCNDDIIHRAAIYHFSRLNFFVNNGTALLSEYNHYSPSALFRIHNENSCACNTKAFDGWKIPIGVQFHYSSPLHVKVWAEDRFFELEKAWNDWAKSLVQMTDEQKKLSVNNWLEQTKQKKLLDEIYEVNDLDLELPIYIWGVNEIAFKLADTLIDKGGEVSCFVDAIKYRERMSGRKILHPFELEKLPKGNLIIAAYSQSGENKYKQVVEYLDRMIFQNNRVLSAERIVL